VCRSDESLLSPRTDRYQLHNRDKVWCFDAFCLAVYEAMQRKALDSYIPCRCGKSPPVPLIDGTLETLSEERSVENGNPCKCVQSRKISTLGMNTSYVQLCVHSTLGSSRAVEDR
jgi:hypothetical protein